MKRTCRFEGNVPCNQLMKGQCRRYFESNDYQNLCPDMKDELGDEAVDRLKQCANQIICPPWKRSFNTACGADGATCEKLLTEACQNIMKGNKMKICKDVL